MRLRCSERKGREKLSVLCGTGSKEEMYKILDEKFGSKGQSFYISTVCNGDLQLPILTFDTAIVSGEDGTAAS